MGIVSILSMAVTLLNPARPEPAPNYYSWYSEDIASQVMEYAVNDEYYSHLDFDGDGVLSVMDAVAIRKRYICNVINKTPFHFGESDVMEIVKENYSADSYSEYFYYEIDFVDGSVCRAYEMDFENPAYIHVYLEMNDETKGFYVMISPAEENYAVR